MKKILLSGLVLAGLLWGAGRAWGLFEVKVTLSDSYRLSHTVVVGTVEGTDVEKRVADVKLTEVCKAPEGGWAVGDVVKVQISEPEVLFKGVTKGAAVVILRDARAVLVHVADRWTIGAVLPSGKVVRVNGLKEDSQATFPGTTASLVEAMAEVKAGKSTILNAPPAKFLSGQEKIAEGEKAEALFTKPAAVKAGLAETTGKFDEKGRERKMVLTKEGVKLAAEEGKEKLAEVDDVRMLGSKLIGHVTEWKEGIKEGVIVTSDANGDGRDDAVIVSSTGAVVLLNRGFGGYFVFVPTGEAFKGALNAKGGEKGELMVLRKNGEGKMEAWKVTTPVGGQ